MEWKERDLWRLGFVALRLAFFSISLASTCVATQPFTVADDIEIVCFGEPYSDRLNPVLFSPDGAYFAVQSGRGLLTRNLSESSIRIYRTEDILQFLRAKQRATEPEPFWVVTKATYKDGPIITLLKWLRDSSAIVFLARTRSGSHQLFLGDIKRRVEYALTSPDQDVTGFDVRSSNRFVYAVRSPHIVEAAAKERDAIGIVGTGRSLQSVLFPVDLYPSYLYSGSYDLSEVWAVIGGAPFRLNNNLERKPLALHVEGANALALSPDGQQIITVLPVRNVPLEWESLYRPPYVSDPFRIRAGTQDPEAPEGIRFIGEYATVKLGSGEIKALANAPTGDRAGWYGAVTADWSPDSRLVGLSNTFVHVADNHAVNQLHRPCVAVADVLAGSISCIEFLKGSTETGYENNWFYIEGIRFTNEREVTIDYHGRGLSRGSRTYVQGRNGEWFDKSHALPSPLERRPIEITVRQGMNDPPVLIARDQVSMVSHILWDPNPQLKAIDLGEAAPFQWSDKSGRDWVGGLYKPPGYTAGRQYPLVLQTHGFYKDEFVPSGVYPTAFAARELATAGFLVLQVPDCSNEETLDEGPCNVRAYEGAVDKLVTSGMVDPDRIGIIGFSRSCYYVMEALTSSRVHFRAASITDGVNEGYFQYLVTVDLGFNLLGHDAEAVNGAMPFGEGLKQWLSRSPEFNMDKVTAPLQVVATDPHSVLGMWEPYAALRHLEKPVDFIILGPGTHVLTNPAQRILSQGGTLDWFRFWLNNEEDSTDPAKASQYARWRELRRIEAQRAGN
jgi:hypothetical protein